MNSLPASNIWYSVTIHLVSSLFAPNSLCLTKYCNYLILGQNLLEQMPLEQKDTSVLTRFENFIVQLIFNRSKSLEGGE
jgi:hypothetical protein